MEMEKRVEKCIVIGCFRIWRLLRQGYCAGWGYRLRDIDGKSCLYTTKSGTIWKELMAALEPIVSSAPAEH